jgi:hypothetical protein
MPNKLSNYFDTWSIVVVITTFILFFLALFVKGFTHDLFLEAGVFLVSVKLIMMGYKNSVDLAKLQKEIKEIKDLISKQNNNGLDI